MANLNFTAEQLEAAKAAKSPEELVAKAKEQGIEITLERAAAFLNPEAAGASELADEELDNVAGGGCDTFTVKCPKCKSTSVAVTSSSIRGTYYNCRACDYSWYR